MKKAIALACLIIILSSCTSHTKDTDERGIVSVLPHVELITGVIVVAERQSYRGLIGNGNVYYRELHDFMEEYSSHNVFKIYEELSADGFEYEVPYAYILHYNGIEELSESIQYNDFMVSSGYDIEILHAFAEELHDLAQESNFYEDFYLEHQELYNSLESDVSQSMEWDDIYDFIERIYGDSSVQCHTILAPATLSAGAGGYSVHIQDNEENNFYNILRTNGNEHDRVVFESDFITPVTVHEWSHVYVNPVVYDKMTELLDEDRLDNLVQLYEPVDEIMMNSGYTSVKRFVDEQITRGITLYFFDEYLSEEEFQEELLRQEAAGFYLTEYTYNGVKEYMIAETNGTYINLIELLIEGYLLQ